MVDISDKPDTLRIAEARGRIKMQPQTLALIQAGTAKKGDVLGTARIAGIMAAKRTGELIPLCHPLTLSSCEVTFTMLQDEHSVEACCIVKTTGPTGVEMEALTGVSVALLTIYDMCKAADRGMVIGQVCLHRKSGGRSGEYRRERSTE